MSSIETALFARVFADGFRTLPTSVRRVHGGSGTFRGRARARGSRAFPVSLLRHVLGLPQPGGYPRTAVEIVADASGETWTRRFGDTRFSSHLRPLDGGRFEERFGPIRFTFAVDFAPGGFRWRFLGWRLGPLPLPGALAPRIRARVFEAEGGYRFRVLTAHPWLGVLFAYAGRLE